MPLISWLILLLLCPPPWWFWLRVCRRRFPMSIELEWNWRRNYLFRITQAPIGPPSNPTHPTIKRTDDLIENSNRIWYTRVYSKHVTWHTDGWGEGDEEHGIECDTGFSPINEQTRLTKYSLMHFQTIFWMENKQFIRIADGHEMWTGRWLGTAVEGGQGGSDNR